MKRTLSAVAAALATLVSAQAHADVQPQPSFVDFTPVATESAKASDASLRAAFPQPSFVDFTVLPAERAQTVTSDSQRLATFPQPSSIAN
jgi:hypothetical protein